MRLGKKHFTLILVLVLIFSIYPMLSIPNTLGDLINPSSLKSHSPIIINGNNDFTLANGVIAGSGSQQNPFIIENWAINAKSNENGIYIRDTTNYFIIRNCHIFNSNSEKNYQRGIYFRKVINGVVENCRIEKNYIGMEIFGGENNIIINNAFINNSDNVIHLSYSINNQISKNVFKFNNGDMCIYVHDFYNTISNNIFIHNNGSAIGIRSSDYNTVTNNICTFNEGGISLFHGSNNNIILYNNCSNNYGRALFVYGNNNTISNNIINSNDAEGIYVWTDDNNSLTNNICKYNNLTAITIRNSNNNIISNNICISTGNKTYYKQSGIRLRRANNNKVTENICNSNNGHGIFIKSNSLNNYISDNICNFNNESGIVLCQQSNDNIVTNNICNQNNQDGIEYWQSKNNLFENNILDNNRIDGFDFWLSESTTLKNNIMNSCGIFICGSLQNWNTHSIDTTNTINGKPVYYWKNKTGGTIPPGAGEVILANCSNINILNQNLSDGSVGIALGFSKNNFIRNIISNNNSQDGILLLYSSLNSIENSTFNLNKGFNIYRWNDYNTGNGINIIYSDFTIMRNNKCNSNNKSGISFYNSHNNTISDTICQENNIGTLLNLSSMNIYNNCTVSLNSNYDYYLENISKNNIAINTTVENIHLHDQSTELIVKNYLHIKVDNYHYNPVSDVDGKVMDNNEILYASVGYNGDKPKTDKHGQIKWISVTDRIYKGSSYAKENKTTIFIKYDKKKIIEIDREVNMSTSHFENFHLNLNNLPDKVTLHNPINNSWINDSTPKLSWKTGTDREKDPLIYYGQFVELDNDLSSLRTIYQTKVNVTNWSISIPLIDDDYHWRVCANDAFGNGSWSDVWKFTIDTIPPVTSILINNGDEYTNSSNISLSLHAYDTSSGISSMAFSTDGRVWSKWEEYNTTRTYNLPTGDGEKLIYYRVQDKAGNIAVPISDAIILDTTPPENLSIIINNNELYTKSKQVKLDLFAIDTLSGINEMSFSTNKLTWMQWKLFNLKKTLSLPPGDGKKNIYFKVSDKVGNIAEPVFNHIFLDTTPPFSLFIQINNGSLETNSTNVTLKLNAQDALSGVHQMSFSTDGYIWNTWENFSSVKEYNLTYEDGSKIIYFKVKDVVGNIADPISASIILNTTIPSKEIPLQRKSSLITYYWDILFLIIIIVLITLISIILIFKQKKLESPIGLAIAGKPYTYPTSAIEKLPEKVTINTMSTQISMSNQIITHLPTKKDPTTTINPSPPLQIPKVAPSAQLPHAQPQITIPTPTIATLTPVIAQPTPAQPEVTVATPPAPGSPSHDTTTGQHTHS